MAIAQPVPASPRPARKSPLRTAGLAAVRPKPLLGLLSVVLVQQFQERCLTYT
jgi:hypothetical protein